jgi:hypothetical protein
VDAWPQRRSWRIAFLLGTAAAAVVLQTYFSGQLAAAASATAIIVAVANAVFGQHAQRDKDDAFLFVRLRNFLGNRRVLQAMTLAVWGLAVGALATGQWKRANAPRAIMLDLGIVNRDSVPIRGAQVTLSSVGRPLEVLATAESPSGLVTLRFEVPRGAKDSLRVRVQPPQGGAPLDTVLPLSAAVQRRQTIIVHSVSSVPLQSFRVVHLSMEEPDDLTAVARGTVSIEGKAVHLMRNAVLQTFQQLVRRGMADLLVYSVGGGAFVPGQLEAHRLFRSQIMPASAIVRDSAWTLGHDSAGYESYLQDLRRLEQSDPYTSLNTPSPVVRAATPADVDALITQNKRSIERDLEPRSPERREALTKLELQRRFLLRAVTSPELEDFCLVRWEQGGCGDDAGIVTLEPRFMRLTVLAIENMSDKPLSVGAAVYRLTSGEALRSLKRDSLARYGQPPSRGRLFPPGVLGPGEIILVPERVGFLRAPYVDLHTPTSEESARDTTAWRRLVTYAESLAASGRGSHVTPSALRLLKRVPWPARQTREYTTGAVLYLDSLELDGMMHPVRPDDETTRLTYAGWEGGSCPHVYSAGAEPGQWVYEGAVMVDNRFRDRERYSAMELHHLTGRALVREEEVEVSRFDYLAVAVHRADGTVTVTPHSEPTLGRRDGRYVTLRRGDSLLVELPAGVRVDDRVFLVAYGYYVPLPHSLGATPPPRHERRRSRSPQTDAAQRVLAAVEAAAGVGR